MHGFGYDAVHDEIVVASPLAQAILIFRGGASGEEAPIRVIQGPHTELLGSAYGGTADRVVVDGVNGEIYAFSQLGHYVVFDRLANGDVAPKRTFKVDGVRGGSLAIDPVHNLLVINSGNNGLVIFDRTVSGDAKPLRTIKGPKTGTAGIMTFQISAARGLIISGCEEAFASTLSVCAWSVNDDGDVAPRYKLPVAELAGYQPSGIALDPVHKEIIMSSSSQGYMQTTQPPGGITNAAFTFSWPEIF
jgi:hypothetical protein